MCLPRNIEDNTYDKIAFAWQNPFQIGFGGTKFEYTRAGPSVTPTQTVDPKNEAKWNYVGGRGGVSIYLGNFL